MDGSSPGRSPGDERGLLERVCILNPASGTGDHREQVGRLAGEHGFAVRETGGEDDIRRFAREAAEAGASVVAAAGGDGTLNRAVQGLLDADALDEVTFGVVPGGTGNNFASNVGVGSVAEAFEVIERGNRRSIDLGMAEGRPFVNSLVGGLTAEASGSTSAEQKERFGILAYVLTTLRTLREFEAFSIELRDGTDADPLWRGEAIFVLIGNARRFGDERVMQANVEDGLFDVAIVESMPPSQLVEEAAVYRLFDAGSDHITRLTASRLSVDIGEGQALDFSFDGEITEHRSLSAEVRPGALEVFVGESYDPDPGEGNR